MPDATYNQFCPVAMAAEALCSRWTIVLLRELLAGSTRFNELRRGLPRMSPALLAKRLKDLELAGIVTRTPIVGEEERFEYNLTQSGRDLKPVIEAFGIWGHQWIETEASLKKLDPQLLMWDIRRNIDPTPMPPSRNTIQFIFNDLRETQRNWWLIVSPGVGADLCSIDPGFDINLYVATDLRTLTEIWMGYTAMTRAKGEGRIVLTGNPVLASSLSTWLKLSPFAKFEKRVA